ncbi:MAG: MMPL family transporter [Myxococcota bacterium]
MQLEIEARIGGWLARWVDAVRRRAPWVVLLVIAVTAGALDYTARNLTIRGDTDALFSEDLPIKRAQRRLNEAFPILYENIFVVVDAATPERAGEAASALAAGMRGEPEHFHRVYLPGGGEFFEQHAFLYLETAELQDLADRLAEAQPYLAELSRDGTLRGLSSLLARGARAAGDGDVGGGQLRPMFEGYSDAVEARLSGGSYQLSWAEVLSGTEFDDGARRRFLLVQPVLDVSDLQPARAAILAIRRIAEELGLSPENGARVRITGDVALSYEEMESLRGQASRAGLASLVLVGAILLVALRSARLVLATLLTLAVGLVWTAGFTTAAIGHLNMISVSFAVLFIGLGVDFGIHLCIRYRELTANGRAHDAALRTTARDVGSSIVLCAATTSIGFFAFVPTDFVGVAELGLISGMGMFISLFLTLTLLPALLSLPGAHPRSVRAGPVWSDTGFVSLPVRSPRAVRAAALALAAGAVLLLPKARFDNNPLNVRDPSAESVQTFNELLERGTSSPWNLDVIAPDLETARSLAAEIRALDEVGRVVSVADYVPPDQDEKLDIIEDVAMFLAPPLGADGQRPRPTSAEQISALRALEAQLETLLAEGAVPELAASGARLHAALGRYLAQLAQLEDPRASIQALEASLLGSLPEQLRMLDAALGAGHVSLQNLPNALLERMIADDGSYRIQVSPSSRAGNQAELAAFVDAVHSVAPNATGGAAEVVAVGRAVVRALRQALLAAVVAITAFLLLLWQRVDDTALVLVPLGLAATFTVAAAVLMDIPFNFADVIVLPLLLGIGVDSGIHLVHRARISPPEGNLLGTSTARAVAFSALTTIASFGTLGFAAHRGLATLGQLLTLGVCFTMICNLVVLPSLIALRSPRRRLVGRRSEA